MAGHARSSGDGWSWLGPALGLLLLGYFALPLVALVLVQSPAGVVGSLGERFVVDAAVTTLLTATVSTLVATVLGVPLGHWLAGADFRGASLVTALVVFPLVLPPVVSGMLLLSVFGESGVGGLLGLRITRTHLGIVLAQTFVAAPFVVLTTKSAVEDVDDSLVEAAWTMGASEWQTFRLVTVPLARRGILAGVTLAFARAAGEFGATLMLAYFPRTLPVQIWATFQGRGLDAAFPVALVLVVVSLLALAVLRSLGSGLAVLQRW
jgi:molybdate/tungstate transport system permease protein